MFSLEGGAKHAPVGSRSKDKLQEFDSFDGQEYVEFCQNRESAPNRRLLGKQERRISASDEGERDDNDSDQRSVQ
jgi:hypothetical protein